jgi:DNA-directed RNA polymerase specialized sigma24 family protein
VARSLDLSEGRSVNDQAWLTMTARNLTEGRGDQHQDDLIQEGWLVLLETGSRDKAQRRMHSCLENGTWTGRDRPRYGAAAEGKTVDLDFDPAPADPGTIEELLRDNRVMRRVVELPQKMRDVIEMHFWGRMSAAEIAETEGVTVKAIEKRLTKAFGLLRESIQDPHDSYLDWFDAEGF